MNFVNKKVILKKRPVGFPKLDDFDFHKENIEEAKYGEVIIKVLWLSLDPYMRGRMNDSMSYAAPTKIGEPMTGETAGIVIKSNSKLFNKSKNS